MSPLFFLFSFFVQYALIGLLDLSQSNDVYHIIALATKGEVGKSQELTIRFREEYRAFGPGMIPLLLAGSKKKIELIRHPEENTEGLPVRTAIGEWSEPFPPELSLITCHEATETIRFLIREYENTTGTTKAAEKYRYFLIVAMSAFGKFAQIKGRPRESWQGDGWLKKVGISFLGKLESISFTPSSIKVLLGKFGLKSPDLMIFFDGWQFLFMKGSLHQTEIYAR